MFVKPRLEDRKKLIIYLDQNFISDIQKAGADKNNDPRLKRAKDLGDILLKLVKEEKVICPMSVFHEKESNPQYRKDILIKAFDLSWDLKFRTEEDIKNYQLADAIADFFNCKQVLPFSQWWEIPYGNDPDLPNSSRAMGNIFICIHRNIKLRDNLHQQNKDDYLKWFNNIKNQDKASGITFEQCRDSEISSCGRTIFVNPIQTVKELKEKDMPPTFNQTCGYLNAMESLAIFEYFRQASKSNKTIKDFIESDNMLNVPFAKIKGTIFAAVLTDKVDYKNIPSSLDDFNINTMVLPYVDIFCTDSGNRELIKQLKFEQEYNVDACTMRDVDQLISRLSAL